MTASEKIVERIIDAAPDISTLKLGPAERGMGKLVKVSITDRASGEDAFDGTPAMDDLGGDIFWNLYDELGEAEEIPPTRQVNKQLTDWMKDSPGFQEAIEDTRSDLATAISSAGLLYNHLTQEKVVQEALKEQEKANQRQSEAEGAEFMAELFQRQDQSEIAQQYLEMAAIARDDAKDSISAAAALLDQVKDDPAMQTAVSMAVREAADRAKQAKMTALGYGLGPDSNVATDASAAVEFLQMATDEIQAIAQIAGRIKGFALTAIREAVKYGPMTTSVGTTKDIMKVLPVERTYLSPAAPPVMRAMKVAKLLTEGLPGWTPTGDGEKAGPFVGAVDFSPSMWGTRLTVAKGIALGLARAAAEEGREYILFCFGSSKDGIKVITSKDGWKDHLEWASAQNNGGTDFNLALTFACDQLLKLEQSDRADIMFISDGEGHVHEDNIATWRQWQEQTGARLMYVPVGMAHEGYSHYNIDEVADEVIPLEEVDIASGTKLAKEMAPYLTR